MRTVKDTDSAVLDTVEDVLDGTFFPAENVDIEGMCVQLIHVGCMRGLVEKEFEGEARDELGILVQQGRDDFPAHEAAAGDDTGLEKK